MKWKEKWWWNPAASLRRTKKSIRLCPCIEHKGPDRQRFEQFNASWLSNELVLGYPSPKMGTVLYVLLYFHLIELKAVSRQEILSRFAEDTQSYFLWYISSRYFWYTINKNKRKIYKIFSNECYKKKCFVFLVTLVWEKCLKCFYFFKTSVILFT